jgi:hypothetical protein
MNCVSIKPEAEYEPAAIPDVRHHLSGSGKTKKGELSTRLVLML